MNEIIRHFWKYNIYYFLMTLSEVITRCLLGVYVCMCMCVCGVGYVCMCLCVMWCVCAYTHFTHLLYLCH